VKLSHRNLLANATQIGVCMGARLAQERFMAVLPMFHVYGLTVGLITSVCQAATMVMTTRFDAADTLELMRRYKPTILPLMPSISSLARRTLPPVSAASCSSPARRS